MEKYEGVKCFRINPCYVCDFINEVCADVYSYFTYEVYMYIVETFGESSVEEE